MNPPAILQRRPDSKPAITVRPDRCERCKFWRMRDNVLSPMVRGNCTRIVAETGDDFADAAGTIALDLDVETLTFVAADFESRKIGARLITPPAFSCSLFERRVPKLPDEAVTRAAELLAGFRHDPPWGGWFELLELPTQARIYTRHALASLRDDDHPQTRDRVQAAARILENFHKDNPQ